MDAEEIHEEVRKINPSLLYREGINGHRGLAKIMQQFEEIQKREKLGRHIYKKA
jgi:hypothetical protein